MSTVAQKGEDLSLINDFSETNRFELLDDQKDEDEERLEERGDQWTEVLSSEPRISIYHNFLSKEECEHLINVARPYLKRSLVSDVVTGKAIESSGRTSHGTFLARGRDKEIRAIEKRIADITLVPIENGEGLQVLHYEVGQKHDPHFDYSVNGVTSKYGGPRKATLLMYLSDVEEGGETVFPKAKRNVSSEAGLNGTSECAKQGISVKPKMGDAVLFWSSRPDKTLDPLSLHGSNPVIKGDKWACTKWLHETDTSIVHDVQVDEVQAHIEDKHDEEEMSLAQRRQSRTIRKPIHYSS